MNSFDTDSVHRLMAAGLQEGVFPGGVLLVSKEAQVVFEGSFGNRTLFEAAPVAEDTVFDLASLTKPLATTLAVMQFVGQGRLDLSSTLCSLLDDLKGADKAQITVRQLLCHNSGLPDYRPYFETLRESPATERRMRLHGLLTKEKMIYQPGSKVVYSDLGFMFLSWIIEQVGGCRLDQWVASQIYRPIEIGPLFYVDLGCAQDTALKRRYQFAATEKCPWRQKVLEGEVHDDNAYVVGGIEGHAGLFGTARAVHALLAQLLLDWHGAAGKSFFDRSLLREFLKKQPDAHRALGFDMPVVSNSSSGRYFSELTVGHLGFTGTSFWIDLERAIIVILLTNRVHPSRENERIKQFRPVLHDTVMQTLL